MLCTIGGPLIELVSFVVNGAHAHLASNYIIEYIVLLLAAPIAENILLNS